MEALINLIIILNNGKQVLYCENQDSRIYFSPRVPIVYKKMIFSTLIISLYLPAFIIYYARIIIVDDEYFNIQSLQLILHRFNAHCDFTFNGQEALKKTIQKMKEPCRQCQNNGYVVFFLDLNMPIMDGFETVKNLKMMMHENQIPKGICIANTGYADLESKQQALNSGMDFYMIKPIQIKELETYLKRRFPQ